MSRNTSLALIFAFAAGCDTGPVPPPPDLAAPMPDIAVPPPDLAMRDMAMRDMAVDSRDFAVVDFTVPPDLVVIPDLVVPGPAPTVIPHPDWMTFCHAFTACGLFGASTNLSTCSNIQPQAGTLSFAPRSILACLANAGADCVKVQTCMNNGSPMYNCDADAGAQPMCGNDVYTLCQKGAIGGFKFANDCDRQGLRCIGVPDPMMPATQFSGCGFGNCVVPAEAGKRSCQSGFQVACNGGGRLVPELDCRVFDGADCVAMRDGGIPGCTGKGPACMAAKCQGNLIKPCIDGKEASFNCQIQGLTCIDSGGGAVRCALGQQCNSAAYTETCNGSVLTFCDMGVVKQVDCVALGWKSCKARVNNAGGYCSAQP